MLSNGHAMPPLLRLLLVEIAREVALQFIIELAFENWLEQADLYRLVISTSQQTTEAACRRNFVSVHHAEIGLGPSPSRT